MTSADIYPLAQRLSAAMPESFRRWWALPSDPSARDRLADTLMRELTEGAEPPLDAEDPEAYTQAVVISETLAGFVTGWGCRYGTLDDEVDRATDNFVLALGGTVVDRGMHVLTEDTPISVAAIAHLIGWVCILDVPEAP
jgi:hypothetical protein